MKLLRYSSKFIILLLCFLSMGDVVYTADNNILTNLSQTLAGYINNPGTTSTVSQAKDSPSSSESTNSLNGNQLKQILGGSLKLSPVKLDFSSLDDFIVKFGKQYNSPSEKTYRGFIYRENQRFVNVHNDDPDRTYNKALNKFADLTPEEFRKIYTTSLPSNGNRLRVGREATQIVDPPPSTGQTPLLTTIADLSLLNSLPIVKASTVQESGQNLRGRLLQNTLAIDWSSVSGGVQDQGYCGCCYAFTPTENIAALLNIKNSSKGFSFLSTQEIIDCSVKDTYGCQGGYIDAVFDYILVNGINDQTKYPFISGSTGRKSGCVKKAGKSYLKNYFGLTQGSCQAVIDRLKLGPVSVGISAYELQLYSDGVFPKCEYDYINHSVLLVGYTEKMFWKIKNGWGTTWGEKGYARIAPGNTCQICQDAWYPDLKA